MKNYVQFFAFIIFWAGLMACVDEDDLKGNEDSPIIFSVTPEQGTPGDTITIEGDRFQDITTDSVFLNGALSFITSLSSDRIKFIVSDAASSGSIVVRNPSGLAIGPDFTVIQPPILQSISPDTGPVGTVVTIVGQNFGSSSSEIEVRLNGELVNVNAVNDTEIEFSVPVTASSGLVSVTSIVSGATATGLKFTVETPNVTVITIRMGLASDHVGIPFLIIPDGKGNFLFSEISSHRIRRITPAGAISNIAGTGNSGFVNGRVNQAQFRAPSGMAIDGAGNIYIADLNNHVIRVIRRVGDPIEGTHLEVFTLAGFPEPGFADGLATKDARFNQPIDLEIIGTNLYISDFANHAIRQLDLQTGFVTTVAGNGTSGFIDGNSTTSQLSGPSGIAVDNDGNLLIADRDNHSIRLLDISTGVLSTVSGFLGSGFTDGTNAEAQFKEPVGLGVDSQGAIYVSDGNHRIRKIALGVTTTIAGTGVAGLQDGLGSQAQFNNTIGLFVVSDTEIWICDTNNLAIRKISIN